MPNARHSQGGAGEVAPVHAVLRVCFLRKAWQQARDVKEPEAAAQDVQAPAAVQDQEVQDFGELGGASSLERRRTSTAIEHWQEAKALVTGTGKALEHSKQLIKKVRATAQAAYDRHCIQKQMMQSLQQAFFQDMLDDRTPQLEEEVGQILSDLQQQLQVADMAETSNCVLEVLLASYRRQSVAAEDAMQKLRDCLLDQLEDVAGMDEKMEALMSMVTALRIKLAGEAENSEMQEVYKPQRIKLKTIRSVLDMEPLLPPEVAPPLTLNNAAVAEAACKTFGQLSCRESLQSSGPPSRGPSESAEPPERVELPDPPEAAEPVVPLPKTRFSRAKSMMPEAEPKKVMPLVGGLTTDSITGSEAPVPLQSLKNDAIKRPLPDRPAADEATEPRPMPSKVKPSNVCGGLDLPALQPEPRPMMLDELDDWEMMVVGVGHSPRKKAEGKNEKLRYPPLPMFRRVSTKEASQAEMPETKSVEVALAGAFPRMQFLRKPSFTTSMRSTDSILPSVKPEPVATATSMPGLKTELQRLMAKSDKFGPPQIIRRARPCKTAKLDYRHATL